MKAIFYKNYILKFYEKEEILKKIEKSIDGNYTWISIDHLSKADPPVEFEVFAEEILLSIKDWRATGKEIKGNNPENFHGLWLILFPKPIKIGEIFYDKCEIEI